MKIHSIKLLLMKTIYLFLTLTLVAFSNSINSNSNITITIQGVPAADATDFNKQYSVYSNGTINLPYIGSVQASGKTPITLARYIESLYKKAEIYTNPTINVESKEDDQLTGVKFTFISQSGSQVLPLQRSMTLQEAVAAGGGAKTFDSKRWVYIERNQKEYKFDMKKVEDRNHKVQDKDVIRLPRSTW